MMPLPAGPAPRTMAADLDHLPPYDRLTAALWRAVLADLRRADRATWDWLLSREFRETAHATVPGLAPDTWRSLLLRAVWRDEGR
jgi:hypothetical protein